MNYDKSVSPRVFQAIQNVDITELSKCSQQDIRPILPCLVRMSLISPLDTSKQCLKRRLEILTLISGIEVVNSIVALLSIDFHALEVDVKKEQQLRQKVGSSQNDSVLIHNLQNGLALEFERSDCTRRLRLVLSELLFIQSQVQELNEENNAEFLVKQSDLFDNAVYIEEICDVICIALSELPTLLNIHTIAETLLHVNNGSAIICRIVANFPDSFHEVCSTLISHGERQEENNCGSRVRVAALAALCRMNSSQALAVRSKCVEYCRMPALAIALSLDHTGKTEGAELQGDMVAFVSGLLLGNDQAIRTWFALFIRTGQKRKGESQAALQQLRDELLRRLQSIILASLDGQLPDSCVVQASALLRLYCAMRGIAGIKFQDEEVSLIVQLLTSHPSPTPAGVRFVSLGLCMLIACPSLVSSSEHERRGIEWVQWLVKEEAYFESASGVSASFGEMLLLMAIHFHSNQLSAICDLVCSTLGMKIPIRPNTMTRMKTVFTQEIFTEQVVAAHAVKVPVTADLNANIPGFLPVHCIHQLLKSRAFAKHNVNIKNWIYRQICTSICPLHPVLPLLVEVFVNSILLPNAKTSEFSNKPLTENEIRRVFQSSIFGPYFNAKKTLFNLNFHDTPDCEDVVITETSLTPQLLLLYYLLLYEDVRLNCAQSLVASGRKVVTYSAEFMGELPIKYLLHQAQKDQHLYAGLFGPLLKLLASHFPHLALVEDWLDDMSYVHERGRTLGATWSSKSPEAGDQSKIVGVNNSVRPAVAGERSDGYISELEVVQLLENIQTSPYKAAAVLQQFLSREPINIWSHAPLLANNSRATLSPQVPRHIQELYKQVWLRLNTVLPRHLWVLSIKSLVPKNIPVFAQDVSADPLQVLRCDERVFRCAPLLTIVLRILRASLAASRSQLAQYLQAHPQLDQQGRVVNETEREELRIALVAAQDSAAVQILLEGCLETPEDRTVPGQMWALREVRSLICSYLHQVFIADTSLVKLVHFQGYPSELLEVTVRGIPSMHICLDFIPELLSQPCISKQVFAVQLLSHLSIQYALPKSMSVAHLAISTLLALLGVLNSEARNKLFMPILPCFVRIAEAFPPLVEDITSLLMQLARISLSQSSLASHVDSRTGYGDSISYENPSELCALSQKIFQKILCAAILKTDIF